MKRLNRRMKRLNKYPAIDEALEEFWRLKVEKAAWADKEAEIEAEADRVADFIESDDKQRKVYEWICIWGIPQRLVSKKLKISQQAVSGLLERYLRRHPEDDPKTARKILDSQRIGVKGLEETVRDEDDPALFNRKPSPDVTADEQAIRQAFLDGGSGYHTPGKTFWPPDFWVPKKKFMKKFPKNV